MRSNTISTFVKAVAAFVDLSFVFQLLVVPMALLMSVRPAQAVTELADPQVSLEYHIDTNEFDLEVNNVQNVEYTLTYQTSQGIEDGFFDGGAANEQNVYQSAHRAGTESSGHNVDFTVQSGKIDLTATTATDTNFAFSKTFTVENGTLSFEKTAEAGYWSVVELGTTYVSPDNDVVQVTFTKLPENPGDLRIQQVVLSPEQMAQAGAKTPFAYEITSSMENGTFEYDLTLPNPLGLEKVAVQYSEDGENFTEVSNTEIELETQNDQPVVTLSGLNHFTIFVVTSFEHPQTTDPEDGYNNIWFTNNLGVEITRVPSGTDGIISSEGANHGKISGYAFTGWNGYKNVFPSGGYDTRVDVYLDMSLATGGGVDKRIDYSSAVSDSAGNHRRDFIFHLGTNPTVANEWLVNASNNSPGWPGNTGFATLTETGWYTLEHDFHDNGSGVLEVTMNIYKKGESSPIGSWTRSNASDVIGSTVGGNRYGWFTGNRFDFDWLAIDNAQIEYTPVLYDFNSTNELNKNKQTPGRVGQDAPYVDFVSATTNSVKLNFVNPQNHVVCFEYRTDGDTSQAVGTANPNPALPDRYPHLCLNNSSEERDFTANEYVEVRSVFGAERDWDFDWARFDVAPEPPVVTIDPTTTKILDGLACGVGSAFSDDGLTVNITNWQSGYILQGRYFTAGGSFGGWNDLSSWGSFTYSGSDASFFAANTGDSPAGAAGWEVRVVNATNTQISNVDSISYTIETNPNTAVCGNPPDTIAPAVPTGLRYYDPSLGSELACGVTGTAKTLWPRWDAHTDSDFSHYEYTSFDAAANPDGWTIGLNEVPMTGTEFVHSWVPPHEGVYGFAIRAVDTAGNKSAWAVGGTKTLADSCQYSVDNSGPTAPVITAPTEGSAFATTPILNSWTAATDSGSGVNRYQVAYRYDDLHTFGGSTCPGLEIDGQPVSGCRDTNSLSRNHTPGLSEQGGVTIWVRAIDTVGNVGAWSAPVHYFYDVTAPLAPQNLRLQIRSTSEFISHEGFTNKSDVTAFWDNPNSEPVTYEYQYWNDVPSSAYKTGSRWINPVSPTEYAGNVNQGEGVHYFCVVAIDTAGNRSSCSDTFSFTYDTTAPTTPENGQPHDEYRNTNDGWYFTWSDESDTGSPVHYEFISSQNSSTDSNGVLNNGVWHNTSSSHPEQNPLNLPQILTVGAAPGVWYWQVRTVDASGNTSDWSEVWNVTIDMEKPVTTLTSPTNETITNEPFTIAGESTDNYAVDFVTLEYSVAGEENWQPITTLDNPSDNSQFSFTHDWIPPTENTYDVRVFATDIAGNVEMTAYARGITYDTTAPVATIIQPTDGQTFVSAGVINVIGEIVDNFQLQWYTFVIENAASSVVAGPGTFEVNNPSVDLNFLWDTNAMPNGVYTVKLSGTDEAGNPQTATQAAVTIANPTPSTGGEVLGTSGTGGDPSTNTTGTPVCSAAQPGAIGGLTIVTTASGATLSWTRPAGPLTHYALEFVRLDTAGNEVSRHGVDAFGNADTTSFTVDQLPGGFVYRFELFGVNDCAPGPRAVATSGVITAPGAEFGTGGIILTPNTGDDVVLGASTDEELIENAANPETTGEVAGGTMNSILSGVLGASTEGCSTVQWWWLIIPGFAVLLALAIVALSGRARTLAFIAILLLSAGGLYKTLCMPWIWVGILAAITVVAEVLARRNTAPSGVELSFKKRSRK